MYCCTIPTAWPGLSRSSIGPRHTSRKHPVTSKGLAKQRICDCSPTSEVNTIKAANFAHLNDLSLLHLVLRLDVQIADSQNGSALCSRYFGGITCRSAVKRRRLGQFTETKEDHQLQLQKCRNSQSSWSHREISQSLPVIPNRLIRQWIGWQEFTISIASFSRCFCEDVAGSWAFLPPALHQRQSGWRSWIRPTAIWPQNPNRS